MNQTPQVGSTTQNQSETSTSLPTSGSANVLPSTTTDVGAQPASGELPTDRQSSRPPALGAQSGGDSTPGHHPQPEEQAAAASASNPSQDEASEIALLAYGYYEAEGYPEGRSLEHWAHVEREVHGRRGR